MNRLRQIRNRRLRGLGDTTIPSWLAPVIGLPAANSGDPNYMPPADTYVGDDGCVYDNDGNRLTCPGGVVPNPGDPPNLVQTQLPTETEDSAAYQSTLSVCAYDNNGNLVPGSPLVCSPTRPDQAASNSSMKRRTSLTDWLNQPLAKGWPSNGTLLLGAVGFGILASVLGGRGRRR